MVRANYCSHINVKSYLFLLTLKKLRYVLNKYLVWRMHLPLQWDKIIILACFLSKGE